MYTRLRRFKQIRSDSRFTKRKNFLERSYAGQLCCTIAIAINIDQQKRRLGVFDLVHMILKRS